MTPSRRAILTAAAGFGLSLNFVARQTFAASQGDLTRKKLIFVICRGGMDGLSVTPPVGDPAYQDLRRGISLTEQALKLDHTFGLHPNLAATYTLAQAGQARFAPAIATPDRARSHFEAQDVLESGTAVVYGANSGWLNRAVGALSKQRKVEAISIGATAPLVMRGPAAVSSWSPGGAVHSEARLPTLLQDLYRDDPVLGPAFARGLATEAMAQTAMTGLAAQAPAEPATMMSAAGPAPTGPVAQYQRQGQDAARKLGVTLAGFMREPNGPQIAAISLDGFDTHANQQNQIAARLSYLDAVLDGIHTGLGPDWMDTVVIAATEFGRTARVNGTGGTDHGTASTALVLGGGLRPGGIIGDWPTLASGALYEARDIAPTMDMRGLFKGVLADHMGLDHAVLDATVFPDSGLARAAAGLV